MQTPARAQHCHFLHHRIQARQQPRQLRWLRAAGEWRPTIHRAFTRPLGVRVHWHTAGSIPVKGALVRAPQSSPAHRRTLRDLVREGSANKPGVYRMLSENGTVLYVGQSRRLRSRLLSYFRAKGRRSKAARILRHAFHIQWEYTPTEFGALLLELRLIKLHRPHFNSALVVDDAERGYVALTGGPVPGLRVVPRSDYQNADVMYGPFRNVSALRDAVATLAALTGMRDCNLDDAGSESETRKLWFASAVQSPSASKRAPRSRVAGCLRHDLGSCGAPCIGRGDPAAYSSAVTMARQFLEGSSSAPIEAAHSAMMTAAGNLEFERAASLRDRIARLSWLQQRLQQFHANVDRLTFRYHALAPDGSEHVYLVRRGTVRAERALPLVAEEIAAWDAQARQVFGHGGPGGRDVPLHDLDQFHLVASWFRRHPAEHARTYRP